MMILHVTIQCVFILFIAFHFTLPVFAGVKEELEELVQLYRLPEYRTGSQVAQISSYDRTGLNDDGFSGKYSYVRIEDGKLVLADLKGPGVIHRIWLPIQTDEFLEFYFDSEEEPRIRIQYNDLFSGKVFPFLKPLVGKGLGGTFCYVPIPYAKSCKIVYTAKPNEILFYQIQYRTLPAGETTETFPVVWSEEEKLALERACELWSRYGQDVSTYAASPDSRIEVYSRNIRLRPGKKVTIFRSTRGGRIVGVRILPGSAFLGDFKDVILRAYWDGEKVPAINAPVSDFFGFAFGKQATRSLLLGNEGEVNYCYLPMPFDKSAQLELEYKDRSGLSEEQSAFDLDIQVQYVRNDPRRENEGKLYVVWRRARPPLGDPYLMLKTKGRGHFVGVIQQAQGLNPGMTLFFEGDDIFTVDGEMRIHGTGSEDLYNGGWYALPGRWDEGYSYPLHGCLTYSIPLARTGGYRFEIGEKVSFEKGLNLTIEHGGVNNSVPVDYTSIAFYYGDIGPETNPTPSAEERMVWHPKKLEYWLQLLPIRAFSDASEITSIPSEWLDEETSKNTETLTLTPFGSTDFELQFGIVKVELEVPVEGEYDLFVTYVKGPSCGRFQINQGQEPIGEVIDAYAPEREFVRKAAFGSIYLKAGVNTLSFKIDGKNEAASAGEFILNRIFLERK